MKIDFSLYFYEFNQTLRREVDVPEDATAEEIVKILENYVLDEIDIQWAIKKECEG